jgi:hypothetical protein
MKTLAANITDAFIAGVVVVGLAVVTALVLIFGDGPYNGPKRVIYAAVGVILAVGWWASEQVKHRFSKT